MHLPVLNVAASDIPERMLVVGDPDRALRVAGRLEDRVEIGRFREYVTLRGRHRGVEVGVVSHGVGAAGAAVCFDELFQAGVRRVIRAGSCGGMQDDVLDGHLVIVTAAVRNDGLTPQLAPVGYPAAASPDIVAALRRAAQGDGNVHEGLALTNAVFYTNDIMGSNLRLWQKAGVKAVEMECAALFVMAGLAGRECGAILTVDGNPLVERDEEMTGYDPHREVVREAVGRMIGIALDALVDDPP
ncbi:MAG: nucleoside phosphorylase [Acidimicrobiia bacterium]|nr:nucleoside phosphorylase [bacterium]MDE0674712.1 nucleoside phosphorylase [bacterium]MYB79879.1 nucleoside phosphorylase [Acidimicrobiia bacterium]MYD40125.1 nucleoside phosphorylase [Acidimicrobiia bacterium]